MGRAYVDPITNKIGEIYKESRSGEPILYLLTAGADPTQAIDKLGFALKVDNIEKVSMGQDQE